MQRLSNFRCAAALLAAIGFGGEAAAASIVKTQDLAFGGFAAGSGGSVTISAAGSRTASGDITLLTSGSSGQYNAASFDVAGTGLATYSISLPADNSVSLTNAQGNSMSLTSFTSTPANNGQLSATGTQTLSVGATLVVGAVQPSGSYTGSFAVTVIFQ